jgi:hypothetical protein
VSKALAMPLPPDEVHAHLRHRALPDQDTERPTRWTLRFWLESAGESEHIGHGGLQTQTGGVHRAHCAMRPPLPTRLVPGESVPQARPSRRSRRRKRDQQLVVHGAARQSSARSQS